MEQKHWTEWFKSIPQWSKITIAFVTFIIGFIIFIQDNYYLAITIIAGLCLLSIFCLGIFFTFARTSPLIEGGKGTYRFEKYHKLSLSITVIIPLFIAVLLFMKPVRLFIKEGFTSQKYVALNIKTPDFTDSKFVFESGPLAIEQLLIGTSNSETNLEITVRNTFQQDILVKSVNLQAESQRKLAQCQSTDEFIISDTFNVKINDANQLSISGNVSRRNQAKTKYRVNGSIILGCQMSFTRLWFDTSFILPANKHTSFTLTVPKILKIKEGDKKMALDFHSFEHMAVYLCTNVNNDPISYRYEGFHELSPFGIVSRISPVCN
jgi:hypothetical protein